MAGRARIGALAILGMLAAGAATAQSSGVPAEFPPDDYTGTQYVDSRGCAFIRAGIGGLTDWVPRVSRSREQLCNFEPTFAVAPPAPAPIDPSLIIEITPPAPQTAQVPPVATRSPAPVVADTATGPGPLPPIVTPPPGSPRVVNAPAPAAPPPSVSLAEACAGRFGVQPGFVSATTGQPIDCGPAPQVAAPVVEAPAVPRMTLAQICADSAATGQRFVNAETGAPILCDAPAPVASVAPAPVVTPPAPPPAATAVSRCESVASNRGDGRYVVRCSATSARVSTSSAPVTKDDIPASNPVGLAMTSLPRPPAGYERVWDDGRINPQRGLASAGDRVSTRSVAPAAVGHRFVQVGSFADPANAARLMGRLSGLGLPVARGSAGGLTVVAAGPFADGAALAEGLRTVRGLGFSDAFTRQ